MNAQIEFGASGGSVTPCSFLHPVSIGRTGELSTGGFPQERVEEPLHPCAVPEARGQTSREVSESFIARGLRGTVADRPWDQGIWMDLEHRLLPIPASMASMA